MKGCIFFKS